MKHFSAAFSLIGSVFFFSFPVIAESLWDIVEDAQNQIIQKYPSENSIAREMALNELKEIAGSNKTEQQKIETIRSKYPASAVTQIQSDGQDFSPALLLYRAPLQWTIHSIEIAYDVDSATNILLSTESLYQEENRKNRDESKGVSTATKINAGAKTKLDADVGGGINIKGWNPFKWFSAKAGFEWITSGYAGIDYDRTKTSQWNEHAQRALSSLFEEKAQILQNTKITNCHLTFSITFKNNTDSDLRFAPQNFSIPVYAGNELLTNAVPDTTLAIFQIPGNASSDLMFRANLNTTSALKLIQYMRSHEPLIRVERGQGVISSADGLIKNAVQESVQVGTVPFRCRDLELQIRKVYQGKAVTIADAMRAINGVFENATFEFNAKGDCVSLMGFPLGQPGEKSIDIHQLPVVGIDGLFTSAPIPATKLNRALSEGGLSIDVADIVSEEEDDETWENASSQLQNHYLLYLMPVAESGDAIAQTTLGWCYIEGFGVVKNNAKAEAWLRKAAEQNLAEAQIALGLYYLDAYETEAEVNVTEAVKWVRKAAEQDLAEAQWFLGKCYEAGIGVPENENTAFNWYKKAAEQDLAVAQYELGECYLNGTGVTENQGEAVKWYRKAAEQDYSDAQNALGFCYANGFGVTENEFTAFSWYKKAADQGDADAQFALGNCYFSGIGVNKNETEAVKWYRKAAEQGVAIVQYLLGNCYFNGIGVNEDETEAVRWYRKAAEQEVAEAQLVLGSCYMQGIGVPENPGEAIKWIHNAAEQELAEAQFAMGECYMGGTGVSEDQAEAVKWYRKAADQDYAEAQITLGVCYMNGLGVAKNEYTAFSWYKKAAEQGLAEAQFAIGECYISGTGVAENKTEAIKWYRKAAEQDLAEAQLATGICYENGLGTSKNITEAVKWYRKAAEQGEENAEQALKRLGY